MRIKFHKKSGLEGVEVKTDFERIEYIPKSRKGLQEYVLVVRGGIPTIEAEPDLYRNAIIDASNPHEVHLKYPELNAEIILTTPHEDYEFKTKNPKVVEENFLFEVEKN